MFHQFLHIVVAGAGEIFAMPMEFRNYILSVHGSFPILIVPRCAHHRTIITQFAAAATNPAFEVRIVKMLAIQGQQQILTMIFPPCLRGFLIRRQPQLLARRATR